ncbi:MAG: DegT/DnrJ/EryC1/StrS family aminotransferase [Acidobacteria bacterium]|nr:DegT/DnrJ/EryC1/StrS family aminotransferase [Acidobacteriota bacterium]
MRVPLIDLQAQYRPLRADIMAAIARVCDEQRFILGPEVEALERELAAMLEVKHVIGVSSGTDALLVALMALGIGPGDEVVTTTFSFFATAGSIARVGARPVLVDIEPATFTLDPAAVERAVTPKTKAIMPVHLYGLSAEMDPIVRIAERAGAAIVEDAAQAIGARYKGRQVGGFGTLACFSFFPTKNLGAFGDAGLVTTDDEALGSRVRALRTHGGERRYYHQRIGGNFRIDALQAAVLRVKAPHLRGWTEARRANASTYRRLFAEQGLTSIVRLPVEPDGFSHIYHQFVVRVPRRDQLRAHLDRLGVTTEIYYPLPFHLQECFRALGHRTGDFPEAERAAAEVLALPIFAEVTEEQQRYVVDGIAEFYR